MKDRYVFHIYKMSSRKYTRECIHSEDGRTGRQKAGTRTTETERRRFGCANTKGTLTSNQANIFDGVMKTAVRTRLTGRTLSVSSSQTLR